MILKGKQLDGFNAAVREGNQEKAMAELQNACISEKSSPHFSGLRKTRISKGITLHAAPGYHFCTVKKCKTQLSVGSPTICPKHQLI